MLSRPTTLDFLAQYRAAKAAAKILGVAASANLKLIDLATAGMKDSHRGHTIFLPLPGDDYSGFLLSRQVHSCGVLQRRCRFEQLHTPCTTSALGGQDPGRFCCVQSSWDTLPGKMSGKVPQFGVFGAKPIALLLSGYVDSLELIAALPSFRQQIAGSCISWLDSDYLSVKVPMLTPRPSAILQRLSNPMFRRPFSTSTKYECPRPIIVAKRRSEIL